MKSKSYIKLSLTLVTIFTLFTVNKKVIAQGCGPASSFNILDFCNISARINCGGDMFYNLANFSPHFNVPKTTEPIDPRRHTISSSALWMGAYSNGRLKVAGMRNRQNGVDYFAGPLSTIDAGTNNAECQKWDRVWRIHRTTIDSFKAGLFTSIPEVILNWPAHGDERKGQAKDLAPFVDVDNDRIYNPHAGDYPAIQGDQMLWWIYNDNGNKHGDTGGEPLGVEVHARAFVAQSSNQTINNTIFIDFKIFNRNTERLDSVYIGNYTDFDLGYPFDDYVGCDTARNSFFVYNGTNQDNGPGGYGINPPNQSVVLLNRKLNKFMYFNNDLTIIGNPTQAGDYYNYLKGNWKDGRCVTYGGDGRILGRPCTDFVFPAPPESNDPEHWNERISGNVPGDRVALGTVGPLTMQPGQMESFFYAYVFSGRLQLRKDDTEQAQEYFENNLVTGIKTPICPINNINIYPNPANEQIFVHTGNLFATNIRLINAMGQEVSVHRNISGENSTVSISVKSLPAGIYTVLVESAEGVAAKKLLISK